MSIRVNLVTIHDDLAGICKQMQPERWADDNQMTSCDPERLRLFLNTGGKLLLAKDGKTIVGAALCYVLYHPAGEDSLYVHELDTLPDYRRQGVATMLMERASELAVELALEEVWVGTEQTNQPAKAFYASLDPSEVEPSNIYCYKL